jgi:hypothetical protein
MKSYLVYQLGYDSDSDQEYLIPTGLFVAHSDNPDLIVAMATNYWGTNWFGLAYQAWDCNDRDAEKQVIFRPQFEAAE